METKAANISSEMQEMLLRSFLPFPMPPGVSYLWEPEDAVYYMHKDSAEAIQLGRFWVCEQIRLRVFLPRTPVSQLTGAPYILPKPDAGIPEAIADDTPTAPEIPMGGTEDFPGSDY